MGDIKSSRGEFGGEEKEFASDFVVDKNGIFCQNVIDGVIRPEDLNIADVQKMAQESTLLARAAVKFWRSKYMSDEVLLELAKGIAQDTTLAYEAVYSEESYWPDDYLTEAVVLELAKSVARDPKLSYNAVIYWDKKYITSDVLLVLYEAACRDAKFIYDITIYWRPEYLKILKALLPERIQRQRFLLK